MPPAAADAEAVTQRRPSASTRPASGDSGGLGLPTLLAGYARAARAAVMGITAMGSINVASVRPAFLVTFLGTGVACALWVVLGRDGMGDGSTCEMAGASLA